TTQVIQSDRQARGRNTACSVQNMGGQKPGSHVFFAHFQCVSQKGWPMMEERAINLLRFPDGKRRKNERKPTN
ncbi:MAG: hypothetical protein KKA78_06980, partial [Alphaproteobacteria bacterium]|nr:hypothetical protein [Alphaproteobacteria bacterium]